MFQTLVIVGLCVVKMAIIVNGGSRNSHEGIPQFSESIKNVSAVIGKDAVLNCFVESLGMFKVGWMRSDQTVLSVGKMVTQNSRYSVSHEEPNKWSLRIHSVRESDEGCYLCQINTQPLLKQSGCIQLQYPPDISDEESSSDTTIHEGRNVTLHCTARGNPTPRIFWRRDDGTAIKIRNEMGSESFTDIFNGSSLKLFNVGRDQMSAYLCIAINGVEPAISKRIFLRVQFSPNITSDSLFVDALEGTSRQIDCLVESFPSPMSYWVKETDSYRGIINQKVLEQSEKYIILEKKISSYKTRMILTINNLDQQDAGSYVCVSGNPLGSSNHTIRIQDIRTTTTTTTTTLPSTTTTTTIRSTTLRTTKTTRRKYFLTSTSTESFKTLTEPSTEFDIEFVTDFPGSNSLFYPGVESYQHHINYINSQSSLHGNFRLQYWLSVSVFLLLKVS